MRRIPAASLAASLALLLLFAGPAHAIDEEANRPVATLESALKLMLQKEPSAGFKDRYVSIYRTVAATHDFDAMARARVGPEWDALEDDAKKRLKNLLFKRIVSAYVVGLDRQDAMALVRGRASEIADDAGIAALSRDGAVVVAFRVERRNEEWRITDVRWEGRDTRSAEREESATLLSSGGVAALERDWTTKIPVPSSDSGDDRTTDAGREDPPAPRRSPRETVEHLQEEIIGIMREATTLGYDGRFRRFQPLIDESHHLPAIAQATIRRPWSKLTEEQRRRFVEKFREFSIARYAGRFDGYSGERFETRSESTQGDLRIVKSDLVKSDGGIVKFDWVLREIGGRWRILNIIVDGVSDLATKKAEYQSIFERRGFPGLLEEVEAQIRVQRTGGE